MEEGSIELTQPRWNIAVNAPLKDLFTYKAPSHLKIESGQSVKVPFGAKNRQVSGLVVSPAAETNTSEYQTKEILSLDDERPTLTPQQLKWLKWVSEYYVYPLGQVQELAFPPLKNKGARVSKKSPIVPDVESIIPLKLTDEQNHVLNQIEIDQYQTYLLHGVTGSGKTEVYIEVITKVLAQNKTALVLVPEISLTPQLIRRFAERLGSEIAVIHSQLTDREKTEQWWKAVTKEKRLLIGARSALFCPIPDLGIIVIDEEHETSFKQEEKLKYNARDVAVVRAQMENCPIILGSATPSLETWHNSQLGKYKYLSMKKRVSDRPLPIVEIINPRSDSDIGDYGNERPHWLSKKLLSQLEDNYKKGLQSALFLNRRGVAPTVQCFDCGFIYNCPNCDISLTLHGQNHLVCHYCNYHENLKGHCPQCEVGEPKAYGLGTEAVENDLKKYFPEARMFRADRDEIQSREAIEEMITLMENREIDFLIGTQMIAKGLDFKNLTVVGIVLADIAFNIPDFRASERSFQLCTQVSGRAGRHQVSGEVVIQTYKPDHPSLIAAQTHNYELFVNQEIEHRKLFEYPPFGKLTAIRLSGIREQEVITEAHMLAQYLRELIAQFDSLKGSKILGPTPSPLSRIKNRYRYHLLIKAQDYKVINFIGHKAFGFIKENFKKSKGVIDVDPYTLL